MNRVNTYSLLAQEGYLISSCLATGLTELRKADVHHKGAFYTALFNLSIGLERLMKAVVIIDHMLEHNMKAPTTKILKSYGHNILDLHVTCVGISAKRGLHIKPYAEFDAIDQGVLRSLNDFAIISRYHNLDSLSAPTGNLDPLELWGDILSRVVEADVSKRCVDKILREANFVSAAISDKTHIDMMGLSKEPLTLEKALALPGLHEQAARFAILRLIKILAPIRDLLSGISQTAFYHKGFSSPPVPLMWEFLDWIWDDRSSVLRKRRWP